jgi:hypothetical protein
MDAIYKLRDDGQVAVAVRPIEIGESTIHLDIKFMGDTANRITLRAAENGMVPQIIVADLIVFGLDVLDEHERHHTESEDDD